MSVKTSKSLFDPVIDEYGEHTIGSLANFQGGYINLGYWKGIDLDNPIGLKERKLASYNLYRLVFDHLKGASQAKVLEVGCGEGVGCKEFCRYARPKELAAVDISPYQIQRCLERNSCADISFKVASAQDLPFEDSYFDIIYSVEAAQHFPSIRAFAEESHRILKKSGKLIITAHFATSHRGFNKLKSLIPTISEGVDKPIPIHTVISELVIGGFKISNVFSIGKHVFPGYDRWLSHVKTETPWSHNLLKAYNENLIDFYFIELSPSI